MSSQLSIIKNEEKSKPQVAVRFAQNVDLEQVVAMARAMVAESRFHQHEFDEDKAIDLFYALTENPATSCLMLACDDSGMPIGMIGGQVMEYALCKGVIAQDRLFYVLREQRNSTAAVRLLLAFKRWAQVRKVGEVCIGMSAAIDMQRFDRLMTLMGFTRSGSNFALAVTASGWNGSNRQAAPSQ